MKAGYGYLLARADALYARHEFAPAAAAYREALLQQPGNSHILCFLGMALFQAGSYSAAGDAFKEALQHNRNTAQAHYGLGLVLRQCGDLDGARCALSRAAALKSSNPVYHLMLAGVLQQSGHAERALEHLASAARLDPGNAQILCLQASCLEQMHRLETAADAIGKALIIAPNHPHACLIGARLERRNGRLESARTRLTALLESAPDIQITYRANYERGRVLDRLGDYDGAFAAFTNANRQQLDTPEARACNGETMYPVLDEYAAISARQFVRWGKQPVSDDGPPPVFLVGFPRSGTTMTEQILCSHPHIGTADEKPLLARALERLPVQGRIADRLEGLTPAQILDMRAAYRAAVAEAGWPGAGERVFIDKHPLTIMQLAYINRVFPEARVIVALRDPRDVCLSCFMQEFNPNAGMINFNTLQGTARFYSAVMGLWLKQRDILTLNRLEIRYEDTTLDLEKQARRMLAFLELPWNDDVLSFHRQQKFVPVTTPSYEAITEPVYRRAVGRWKRYAGHLSPVLDTLSPLVKALGYE